MLTSPKGRKEKSEALRFKAKRQRESTMTKYTIFKAKMLFKLLLFKVKIEFLRFKISVIVTINELRRLSN